MTAEEYISAEEDLTINWREKFCTTVVSECENAAKRPALEQDESSDEERRRTSNQHSKFLTVL